MTRNDGPSNIIASFDQPTTCTALHCTVLVLTASTPNDSLIARHLISRLLVVFGICRYEKRYQARRKAETAGGMGKHRGYGIALNMPPLAMMDDVLFDSLNLDSNGDPLQAGSRVGRGSAVAGGSDGSNPWHVVAVETYRADNSKELTIRAGDVLEVLDNGKKWWKVQHVQTGNNGFVPSNFLQTMDGADARGALPLRTSSKAAPSGRAGVARRT